MNQTNCWGLNGVTRRGFVTGGAMCGIASVVSDHDARASEAGKNTGVPENSSRSIALSIGYVPVNITGHPTRAIGINGSCPAPTLRWREGDRVEISVTNNLDVVSSLHWHGIRLPSEMDGVPGLSFAGIKPGERFTYRFDVRQSGTYWYHSHSGFQEQKGLFGAIIIDPHDGYVEKFDRDYVVILSDWTDINPKQIVSNLKFQSDYYNFRQRTAATFVHDLRNRGFAATVRDRLAWGSMNMSPSDIADVSGNLYTYLVNGQSPDGNWTGLFTPGERIRLRVINASAMSLFDFRIPGLSLTVIQADGNDVQPVTVDEFRIGPAETYDLIVTPHDAGPYTIFAQEQDRTGYARATLATHDNVAGIVPPMDSRPLRTMADMGMAAPAPVHRDSMAGMGMMPTPKNAMPDETMGKAMVMHHGPAMSMAMSPPAAKAPKIGVETQNVAMMPFNRLSEPGDGLEGLGRRVLVYTDLKAIRPGGDPRMPSRDITLHLTGNMERFIWGFDGKKFSEAEPIRLHLGERVRFTLINDTMMEHPIHLHGLWSELENGHGAHRPYKHTILVKPGEKLSYLVSADVPGLWAYHCHLLYHMEVGMFRTVVVS